MLLGAAHLSISGWEANEFRDSIPLISFRERRGEKEAKAKDE
jgi:hypothetical protein